MKSSRPCLFFRRQKYWHDCYSVLSSERLPLRKNIPNSCRSDLHHLCHLYLLCHPFHRGLLCLLFHRQLLWLSLPYRSFQSTSCRFHRWTGCCRLCRQNRFVRLFHPYHRHRPCRQHHLYRQHRLCRLYHPYRLRRQDLSKLKDHKG